MTIFSVLQLLLGLSFFLYGMHVMSGNLEKIAGGRLETLLKKMTARPLAGLLLGVIVTLAIQSSSAVTVMLVGLVNSGIMNFAQTIYIIFGANIGTTLTAWILSLSGIEGSNIWIQLLKPEHFSPLLAFLGILLLMVSKSSRRRSIGSVLLGFAILMYGMEFMKEAVSPLAEMPAFSNLMVQFANPLLGVLAGALITALIQSSSASVGILQALSLTGGVTYSMAIPLVMGQNIGTCITAIISCIGASANARRVATVHLSINVLGTAVCLALYTGANAIFHFGFGSRPVSPVSIAVIHSLFNIAITVILLPFTKGLIRLSALMVKDRKNTGAGNVPKLLDERLLFSPSVAVQACEGVTEKMGSIAEQTVREAIEVVRRYDKKVGAGIEEHEVELDRLEDQLGSYLVKLSSKALSTEDSRKISRMLHAIGDFERLGDHGVNLLKVSREMEEKKISFSAEAAEEIDILSAAIREILSLTMQAFRENDVERAKNVEPLEQVIDRLTTTIRDHHIRRLQSGDCTIEMGFILSDLLTNFERISDHCSNLAVAVIEIAHNSFDTHKYLRGVKYGNAAFDRVYSRYAAQFQLKK